MLKKSVQFLIGVSLLLFLIGSNAPGAVQAVAHTQNDRVPIYIFWGDGCPHCARALDFLERLQMDYPSIEIHRFEVYFEPQNVEIFIDMAARYGFEASSVPTIFIADQYLTGYSEDYNAFIESQVVKCMQQGCPDPWTYTLIQDTPAPLGMSLNASATPLATASATITPGPTLTEIAATTQSENIAQPSVTHAAPGATSTATAAPAAPAPQSPQNPNRLHTLDLPLLGSIDLEKQSSILSTLLIALVDGFNPCSIWVLTMLLALTIHSGSRRRVLLIGLVFLSVTAFIYALFIAGLFSVMMVIEYMGWVQMITALVALVFGIINIKDYFWYKEGVSLTIADEKKPGIYKRMRAVMDAGQSTWGMVGATIVLAVGVSLVEFSCTAGFPVLWVNLLTAQQVSATAFIFLLLLYMLIYQLDELAIFFTAVFSLKASRLEEKHGRFLKLVGGVLMLSLAGVMLFQPSLMNSLDTSLLVFGGAFAATLLVLLVHRVILPRLFGIWIGSETK